MLTNNCKSSGMLDELLIMDPKYMGLIGADGEDDDAGGDDDNSEGGDDTEDNDGASGGSGGDEDNETDEVKGLKSTIANFDEERNRWRGKISAAEKRASEAEAELAKVKKDGTSDETLKQETATVKQENADLRTANDDLRIENAFLRDNTHEWVDPSVALRLADLTDVEIDDKGKVHGLKQALDKLAANSSYLIKPKGQQKPPPKKTGDKPGDKDSGDAKSRQAREAQLKSKYPGLRR